MKKSPIISLGLFLTIAVASNAMADTVDDAKKLLFGTFKKIEKWNQEASCQAVGYNSGKLADRFTAAAIADPNPKAALKREAAKTREKILRVYPASTGEVDACVDTASKIAEKKIELHLARKAEADKKKKEAEAAALKAKEDAEKKRLAELEKQRQAKLEQERKRKAAEARKRRDAQRRKAAAAKEKADKEKAAKERAAKEQAEKDKAARRKAARELAAKQRASKEKAAKEKAAKNNQTKDKDDGAYTQAGLQRQSELSKQNTALSASLAKAQQDNAALQSQLNEARAGTSAAQAKVAQLQDQLKATQSQIDQTKNKKNDPPKDTETEKFLKAEVKRLAGDLNKAMKAQEAQRVELSASRKFEVDAKRQIASLTAENKKLKEQSGNAGETTQKLALLTQTVTQQKSEIASLKADLDSAKAKLNDTEAALKKAKAAQSQGTKGKTAKGKSNSLLPPVKPVAGLPVRDDEMLVRFCKQRNTDKGKLNVGLYRFCLKEESEGYQRLANLMEVHGTQNPWLSDLVKFAMRKWEERGNVTSYNMANFTVKEQFDAFQELEGMKKAKDFDQKRYDQCVKKWVTKSSIEYLMAGYCYNK